VEEKDEEEIEEEEDVRPLKKKPAGKRKPKKPPISFSQGAAASNSEVALVRGSSDDCVDEAVALNDPTSLTKQQKYVFEKSKKDLPPELQEQWTQLLQSNSAGIQKKRNQFINSLVPKSVSYSDFVTTKAVSSLIRFYSKEDKVSRTAMASGRTRTQMIGDLGVHGRELFKEGLDCKDIWQDPKDGLYYMRTNTVTRFQSQREVE